MVRKVYAMTRKPAMPARNQGSQHTSQRSSPLRQKRAEVQVSSVAGGEFLQALGVKGSPEVMGVGRVFGSQASDDGAALHAEHERLRRTGLGRGNSDSLGGGRCCLRACVPYVGPLPEALSHSSAVSQENLDVCFDLVRSAGQL